MLPLPMPALPPPDEPLVPAPMDGLDPLPDMEPPEEPPELPLDPLPMPMEPLLPDEPLLPMEPLPVEPPDEPLLLGIVELGDVDIEPELPEVPELPELPPMVAPDVPYCPEPLLLLPLLEPAARAGPASRASAVAVPIIHRFIKPSFHDRSRSTGPFS